MSEEPAPQAAAIEVGTARYGDCRCEHEMSRENISRVTGLAPGILSLIREMRLEKGKNHCGHYRRLTFTFRAPPGEAKEKPRRSGRLEPWGHREPSSYILYSECGARQQSSYYRYSCAPSDHEYRAATFFKRPPGWSRQTCGYHGVSL
jgi:hypothetical protein